MQKKIPIISDYNTVNVTLRPKGSSSQKIKYKFRAFPNPCKKKSNSLFLWYAYSCMPHGFIIENKCTVTYGTSVSYFVFLLSYCFSQHSVTHFCWPIIIIFKLHVKHSPPLLSLQGHDIPPSFPLHTNVQWNIKIAKLTQEKSGVAIKHFTFHHFQKFAFRNTPPL